MADMNTPDPSSRSNSEPPQLSDEQLAKACSNYDELLKKTPGGDRFPRIMEFDKETLLSLLGSAPGSTVRVYYGLLDETMGDGFEGAQILFMAPVIPAGIHPLFFQVAVPGCIGERPPCSLATNPPSDRFIRR